MFLISLRSLNLVPDLWNQPGENENRVHRSSDAPHDPLLLAGRAKASSDFFNVA